MSGLVQPIRLTGIITKSQLPSFANGIVRSMNNRYSPAQTMNTKGSRVRILIAGRFLDYRAKHRGHG